MAFLNGRVTYVRYQVEGPCPLPFGPEHLQRLEQFAIGETSSDTPDGVSAGWAGGEHVLDTRFELEKNIIDDALHISIRVDTDKIPGDLLQAYTRIELDARAQLNASGNPTKLQREEAKEAARARAEAEAADGRFRRRKHYPVLWDARMATLYAGTTSTAVLDRLRPLFQSTFGLSTEPITAGTLALAAGAADQDAQVALAPFTGDDSVAAAVWTGKTPGALDHWGNEFLVWLWHQTQNQNDPITLPDGSEVAVLLARTLTLDCPRGETGCDTLKDHGPGRLPEAMRALQAGKLPRKAGLILARHGAQYELVLQAESLAVSSLALPKIEDARGHDLKIARVESLREAVSTLDLLFQAFAARRSGAGWDAEVLRIREWLRAA